MHRHILSWTFANSVVEFTVKKKDMACVSIVKILWTKIKKIIWKNKKKMKAKTIILNLGGIFKMMCGKLRRIEILQ